MATHVDKVSDVNVPAMSCAEFVAQLQMGDILFCSGSKDISTAIERETKSPWSHVGYVWMTPWYEPAFIEAVFGEGVRVSRLIANYVGSYSGDVVLCRRSPGLISAAGQVAIVAKAFSRVGTKYDWQSEVEQAAHKALGWLPEHATANELYCSGLVHYGSTAWDPPLQQPDPNVQPSPEDNWCDPTVWPVAKLLMGAN